jgi:hypothetical protein
VPTCEVWKTAQLALFAVSASPQRDHIGPRTPTIKLTASGIEDDLRKLAPLTNIWIETCRQKHELCPLYNREDLLPTQLIDVVSIAESDDPGLILTEDLGQPLGGRTFLESPETAINRA